MAVCASESSCFQVTRWNEATLGQSDTMSRHMYTLLNVASMLCNCLLLIGLSLQARATTPAAIKGHGTFDARVESPDSPLVFPWSQDPKSTGAASAYASLSDSYLSRPPSQTSSQAPSQAPSPSKRAQRVAAAAVSPAQPDNSSVTLSSPHVSQALPDMPSPSGPVLSPHPAQRTFQTSPGRASSPERSNSQDSPSALPSLAFGASYLKPFESPSYGFGASSLNSSGPPSNGPVSVAPWRQPAARSGAQSPSWHSLAQSGNSLLHAPLVPSQAPPLLTGDMSHRSAEQEGGSQQAPEDSSAADTFASMLQHRPTAIAQEAAMQLPWEQPQQQQRVHTARPVFQTNVVASGGLSGSQADSVSRASSTSDDAAVDGLGCEREMVNGERQTDHSEGERNKANGSMPPLHKGKTLALLPLHVAQLAVALVNARRAYMPLHLAHLTHVNLNPQQQLSQHLVAKSCCT